MFGVSIICRYFGSLPVAESRCRYSPLPVAKPNFTLFTYLDRKQGGSSSCQEEMKNYEYCKNMLYKNFRQTYALVAMELILIVFWTTFAENNFFQMLSWICWEQETQT